MTLPFPLWSVLFFLEVPTAAPLSLRPAEEIVAHQWWICVGCTWYQCAVALIWFSWAYALPTIFRLSASERYTLFLLIMFVIIERPLEWPSYDWPCLFFLLKNDGQRQKWCAPAQQSTILTNHDSIFSLLKPLTIVKCTYLYWTYIFKGADFNKINGFNGFCWHCRDDWCPVPPPMSTYEWVLRDLYIGGVRTQYRTPWNTVPVVSC